MEKSAVDRYGKIESIHRPIADDMGISDRTFQEARWRGGGNITKLRTTPNIDYAQIFEDLVHENADHLKVNPRSFLRDVAMGKEFLFSLPGGEP